jgi:hypothetical protein
MSAKQKIPLFVEDGDFLPALTEPLPENENPEPAAVTAEVRPDPSPVAFEMPPESLPAGEETAPAKPKNIQPVETLGEDLVTVTGDTITMRRSFRAPNDLVVSSGKTFVVPRGTTLYLSPERILLENNVVFNVEGTVYVAPSYTIWISSAVSTPARITGNGIIHLDQRGALLNILQGTKLILEDITLDGLTTSTKDARGNNYPADIGGDFMDNSTALVIVLGELEMRGRATITGNTNAQIFDNGGGGVILQGGSLTMNGRSRITGNTVSSTSGGVDGGGVKVGGRGTIVMNNQSSITGNLAKAGKDYANGGGVRIWYGSLIMNDEARIADNTANCSGNWAAGGGVNIAPDVSSILTMNGGIIEGNRVSAVNRGGSQLEVENSTAQYGDGKNITKNDSVSSTVRGRK